MSQLISNPRFGRSALSAGLLLALLGFLLGPAGATQAALVETGKVFCTGQGGASIAFADLTVPSPAFGVVTQPEVETLNPLVGAMIR